MLKKLTPNLMVKDVNKTIQFYEETLGFAVIVTVPQNGEFNWALVKCGDVDLMLQKRESLIEEIPALKDKEIGGSLTLYIEATDIEALFNKVKDKVAVVQDLHTTFYGKKEFSIEDCNGYVLAFSQRS